MSNCINCTDIGADTAINGNRYVCKECRQKDFERKAEAGALHAYNSEFVVIDGLSQHKDGLSYYEWLQKHLT